jgi:hypothetical protein
VALEPPYVALRSPADLSSVLRAPSPLPEAPPDPRDIVCAQVHIGAEEKADWIRSERLIKQLRDLQHRAWLEICGNAAQLDVTWSCQAVDWPLLETAFCAELPHCALGPPHKTLLRGRPPEVWRNCRVRDYFPPPPYSHLLTGPDELRHSTFEALLVALERLLPPALGIYQLVFQPVCPDHDWHANVELLVDLEFRLKLLLQAQSIYRHPQQAPSGDLRQMAWQVETKAHNDKPFYCAALRLVLIDEESVSADTMNPLAACTSLLQHGGRPLQFLTKRDYDFLPPEQLRGMILGGLTYRPGFLVNSRELAALVHVPPGRTLERHERRIELLDPFVLPADALTTGTYVGEYRRAGRTRPVNLSTELRRHHTHIIGRPGWGKSVLLWRGMIPSDIRAGAGLAVLDPHGDLAEDLLRRMPVDVIDRVIYMDPGDPDWIPLWNPMQLRPGQEPTRVAGEIVRAFKSFVTGWGDRVEYLLKHGISALLHQPGSTLLDVALLLREKCEESKRMARELAQQVPTRLARSFWEHDFARYGRDATGPAQHKLGKLLLGGTVAQMLSQPASAFTFREIMDEGRILIVNLARLDRETRESLGSMILALLHMAALSRSAQPAAQRRPFHIYCDEAPLFITDALEDMLCQDRKFGVSLTLAHQHLRQLARSELGAVEMVASTLIFRVGQKDARQLSDLLRGEIEPEVLMRLPQFQAILRTEDHIARVHTPRPDGHPDTTIRDRIVQQSRQRYCAPAAELAARLMGQADRSAAPVSFHADVPEFTYDEFP